MAIAETGHAPNRFYQDQDGNIHLNGSSLYLDESGTALTPTEASYFDGVTPGTVTASKGLIVDSNKDLSALRNLTLTNIDAGASGTAGTVDVFPSTASKGKLAISCTDQTGDTTVSLVAGAMAAARTITIPDPGTAANVLMSTGTSTATDATSAEITRTCDVSARSVLAGATLAVTEALHDGKTIKFDQAAGSVCTLPAASGSGARFRFATFVIATSNSHIVKVANGTDIFVGAITVIDAADDSLTTFAATATSDTITLNRTTSGSVRIGEMIEVEDIKTGFWSVRGVLVGTGGEATPFSATV